MPITFNLSTNVSKILVVAQTFPGPLSANVCLSIKHRDQDFSSNNNNNNNNSNIIIIDGEKDLESREFTLLRPVLLLLNEKSHPWSRRSRSLQIATNNSYSN